jgi:hypothetical protein
MSVLYSIGLIGLEYNLPIPEPFVCFGCHEQKLNTGDETPVETILQTLYNPYTSTQQIRYFHNPACLERFISWLYIVDLSRIKIATSFQGEQDAAIKTAYLIRKYPFSLNLIKDYRECEELTLWINSKTSTIITMPSHVTSFIQIKEALLTYETFTGLFQRLCIFEINLNSSLNATEHIKILKSKLSIFLGDCEVAMWCHSMEQDDESKINSIMYRIIILLGISTHTIKGLYKSYKGNFLDPSQLGYRSQSFFELFENYTRYDGTEDQDNYQEYCNELGQINIHKQFPIGISDHDIEGNPIQSMKSNYIHRIKSWWSDTRNKHNKTLDDLITTFTLTLKSISNNSKLLGLPIRINEWKDNSTFSINTQPILHDHPQHQYYVVQSNLNNLLVYLGRSDLLYLPILLTEQEDELPPIKPIPYLKPELLFASPVGLIERQ